jgi:cyclophilin family peptidyl-prolyl cis-trans isomerase/HEAT repeat protein
VKRRRPRVTGEHAAIAEKMFLSVLCVLGGCLLHAQQTTRLGVLQAEDRRAPTPRDLATIRAGARSGDPQTARVGVRALGRLERPALIPDILPSLRNEFPEVRVEAANAVGQAAQGWKGEKPPAAATVEAAAAPLVARLKVEAEPDVRAAICETLGRLPYATSAQAETAERTLVEMAGRAESVTDRLGVAKGLEAFVRTQRNLRAPGDETLALLRRLATPPGADAPTGARIRRLALEALITAGAVDAKVVATASHDPDAQVRRIAMRAAAPPAGGALGANEVHTVLSLGLVDDSPAVRLEALRSMRARNDADSCTAAHAAVADRDVHVALTALDQLGACGAVTEAVLTLEHAVTDLSGAGSARGWHRAAHALVALASAAPDRATTLLAQFTGSRIWQLRMYAARAAAQLGKHDTLEALATHDEDDNVREAAVDGLKTLSGHEADSVYIAELSRPGNQIVRAAAAALDATPHKEDAVPALKAAWERLVAAGKDNSHDARDAIAKTLTSVGDGPTRGSTPTRSTAAARSVGADPRVRPTSDANDLDADELRRLASPRARITIRDVGTFELALFTSQAPATVLRFARLAESGYYNGTTFHRVVPNFVIQGGSPGANEYIGDASFMRDEVGTWPHVRGAVGISTRGHDTGDAQIFVDLVDNPRLDHQYTVFAQVLNGIDIVDRILEGDVIERVEIVP